MEPIGYFIGPFGYNVTLPAYNVILVQLDQKIVGFMT